VPYRDVRLINTAHEPGLSRDPTTLHTGGNSGYQAINLAYLLGASIIVLLAYDMRRSSGAVHWHGEHRTLRNPSEQTLVKWVRNFDALAEDLDRDGVPVINCTLGSALRCFPRARLDEVL
jgi:hypothetical protein